MVIMNNDTASIRVAINSLAAFASFVLKSILLECPDKLFDRGIIPEYVSHKETAMAGWILSHPQILSVSLFFF